MLCPRTNAQNDAPSRFCILFIIEMEHLVRLTHIWDTGWINFSLSVTFKFQVQSYGNIFHIATLDLKERPILEDGPSGLIKSDLTNRPPPPTHPPPPTPVQMDC